MGIRTATKKVKRIVDSIIKEEYMGLLDSWDSLGLWLFLRTITVKEEVDLYGSFPKDFKVKYKRIHTSLEKAGYQIAASISVDIDCLAAIRDDQGLREVLDINGALFILNMCTNETISYIEDNLWTTEF